MPRPKLITPNVPWKVHIPEDLAAQVEILLADPMTGRRKYSVRNELITRLLREWLSEQQRKGKTNE